MQSASQSDLDAWAEAGRSNPKVQKGVQIVIDMIYSVLAKDSRKRSAASAGEGVSDGND